MAIVVTPVRVRPKCSFSLGPGPKRQPGCHSSYNDSPYPVGTGRHCDVGYTAAGLHRKANRCAILPTSNLSKIQRDLAPAWHLPEVLPPVDDPESVTVISAATPLCTLIKGLFHHCLAVALGAVSARDTCPVAPPCCSEIRASTLSCGNSAPPPGRAWRLPGGGQRRAARLFSVHRQVVRLPVAHCRIVVVYETVVVPGLLLNRRLAFMELGCLGTAGERCRRGAACRDRHRNPIEITDTDFALMPCRGVPFCLRCELGLLQFGIGGHATLAVIVGEVEHRQIEAVEPGQGYKLEAVAHL
jgi:hypothetical protein